jgi:FkbH-like protein
MNFAEMVTYIGSRRIFLRCEDDQIKFRSSEETLPEFLSALRENKPSLLQSLSNYKNYEILLSPLSYNQEALWFVNKLSSTDSHAYNVSVPLQIFSGIDLNKMRYALEKVTFKHEQLRTVFDTLTDSTAAIPCQMVLDHFPVDFTSIDGSGLSDSETRITVETFCYQQLSLSKTPPFKVLLVTRSPKKHVLVFLFHHIISDAYSIGIFLKDLEYYFHNTDDKVTDFGCTYTDFLAEQKEMLSSSKGEELWQYWKRKTNGVKRNITVPPDLKRPQIKNLVGATIPFHIDSSTIELIASYCRQLSITPFAFYAGCCQLLTISLSGSYSLLTGVLAHGRKTRDHAQIFGYFVNVLPLICERTSQEPLSEHFKKCYQDLLELLDNQYLPFPLLVEKLSPDRDPSHPVLFNILFNMLSQSQLGKGHHYIYADTDQNAGEFCAMKTETFPLNQQEGQFDITLELVDKPQGITGLLKYSTELYSTDTAKKITSLYCSIIDDTLHTHDDLLGTFLGKYSKESVKTTDSEWKIVVAATFTADMIEATFDFWKYVFKSEISWTLAPYNQIQQQLMNPSDLFAKNSGINVILVRLEDLLLSTDSIFELDTQYLRIRVNELINQLRAATREHSARYIVCVCPSSPRILENANVASYFLDMEKLLQREIENIPAAYFVGSRYFTELYCSGADYEPTIGIIGHMPYTESFYVVIATAIIRTIHAIIKPPCKAIIVDCDNTLWEGVAGEDPISQIHISEPMKSLQHFLKKCRDQGILICLCSKNNRDDIIAVFNQHPDMILPFSDIAFDRINWEIKSKNIMEIIREANLSISGIVFIDDNPSECAEVRANCPGVTVIQLSSDLSKRMQYIKNFWAFDTIKITQADRERQDKYLQEKSRRSYREQVESFADFIKGLELNVTVCSAREQDISRMSQLSFRTNQFTIGSGGKSEEEMSSMCRNNNAFVVDVKDRFGDYGTVGVITFLASDTMLTVTTLLLSCRALGRGVEYQLLSFIGTHAESLNCPLVCIKVFNTTKNKPFQLFLSEAVESYKTDSSDEITYEIPSSILKKIVFDPLEKASLSLVEDTKAASMPIRQNGFSSDLLDKIASSYSTMDSLLYAISEYKKPPENLLDKDKSSINVAPRNNLEATLSGIWVELLGIEHPGITDNFFDQGGRSVMLPFVIQKIKDRLNLDLAIVDLFQYPTISSLAFHISEGTGITSDNKAAGTIAQQQRNVLARVRSLATKYSPPNSPAGGEYLGDPY